MSETFLPEIKQETAIVAKNTGRATPQFLRFFNVDFRGAIKRLLDGQASQIADIQEIVAGLQAVTETAQAAAIAANNAQATADGSGAASATDTSSVTLTDVGVWVDGPLVSLTGVVAGNLTFTGSGPFKDGLVSTIGMGPASGEYRFVEVIGGIDEVLLTVSFNIAYSGSTLILTNTGAGEVAAFTSARASTGAVDYRVDARVTSGAGISTMPIYLFARRAA